MTLKIEKRHILSYRERTISPSFIVLHCSKYSVSDIIKYEKQDGVSAHYLISQKGKIIELVDPKHVAFHAGLSFWYDTKGLNEYSIGIEIEAPSLGQNKKDYPKKLIKVIKSLVKELSIKYHIRKENVVGHSDIAPNRKPDPGRAFPWNELAKEGLCCGYNKNTYSYLETDNEIELLKNIGYDTTSLTATRYAFCRRFLPKEIKKTKDILYLVNNPYPKDFTPSDKKQYLNTLKNVAQSFKEARKEK